MGKVLKKIGKVIKSSTKAITKSILNPFKATKELLHNPLNFTMKVTGLDVLFGGDVRMPTPQLQRGAAQDEKEAEGISDDRRRMLTRQGMQSSTPVMLTGQDMQDTSLNEDVELGGRGR